MRCIALGLLIACAACGSDADGGDAATPTDESQRASDDPTTEADPGAALDDPGEVPEEWACLGEALDVPEQPPARVLYTVPVVDFNSQPAAPIAIADLQVEVCGSGSCERPLPRCVSDAPAPTQQCFGLSAGAQPFWLMFDLPYSFANGTLRFTAPGYAPLDYSFGGPLVGTPEGDMIVSGLALPMLTEESRAALYRDLGLETVDPTRGMLVARVLGCGRAVAPLGGFQGLRAAGVRVDAAAPEALEGAIAFGLASSNIGSFGAETDETGVAGFLNAPAQSIAIGAETPGGPLSTVLRVRPGVVTIAELRPGLERWGQ